jgi:hypothetical protein
MAQHPGASQREIDIVFRAFNFQDYAMLFLVVPPAGEGRRLDVQP